jgi:uncharacterized protein (TIGR02145 family)
MKKVVLSFIITMLCFISIAQVPESFNYQAIPRNSSGGEYPSQAMKIRINILSVSPTGSSVYCETFAQTTTSLGLLNLQIGKGTPESGNFTTINWGSNSFYLKVEIDVTGGTSYAEMGTTQLLSVPYAMHAKTVASYPEIDPVFVAHPANGITGTNITNWTTAYEWGNHGSAGYVPNTRTITINGAPLDLTANRSWSVGTVTSVGLSLPAIFTLTGSPLTTSGTLTATLASQTANMVFSSPDAGAGVPVFRSLVASDIPNLDWSKITSGKPTTLSGYGITDAVNTIGNQTIAGNKIFTGTTTVPTPVDATDATTKAYVDAVKAGIYNELGIVKDTEGNIYKTIKIGNQVWMAENLSTTKYNDGTPIPLITDNTAWSNLLTPGYCWYGNYKNTCGALYNWYTVQTGKLCLSGWHAPTDAEWTTLENYLITNRYNYDGTTTGNKIGKALASTTLWKSTNTPGVPGNTDFPVKRNATGFTAFPGGCRYLDGTFTNEGTHWIGWSATEDIATKAWSLQVNYGGIDTFRYNFEKQWGFSVRCIKD